MERTESPEPTRPSGPQTIVIERPRGGWIGRLIGSILLLFLLLSLFRGPLGAEAGLPMALSEEYVAGAVSGPKIAVVRIVGTIEDDEVQYAIRQLRQARDDDRVRAVVLRIDSPGGTVSGSDRIWREVELLKKQGKPVVASLGGMAASGGYYVAAAADHIYAEPTTLTGSIGVIMEAPVVEGLLSKLGVEFQTIRTGKWKDSPSLFRPMTGEEQTRWRQVLDDAYGRFVSIVARGRGLDRAAVLPVADGRVLTATEAVQAGLVNEIGYEDDAILHAQRSASIAIYRVIRYSQPRSLAESLLGVRSAPPALEAGASALLKLQSPRLLYLAR